MQAVVAVRSNSNASEAAGSCCDESQHETSLRGTFDGVRSANITTSDMIIFGCETTAQIAALKAKIFRVNILTSKCYQLNTPKIGL